MKIGDAPFGALLDAFAGPGVEVDFGLVRVRFRTSLPRTAARLRILYANFPLEREAAFCDVEVELRGDGAPRRVLGPRLRMVVDGEEPFQPYPPDTDLPLLEWGLNWCIAQRCHHVLLLHAGVVDRGGKAVVLPALPGSGKSTLTAALALSGWRFLADEFGAVRLSDGLLLPVVRPTGLKNESIEVIRGYSEKAVLGPRFPGTHKGTVAHLAPDPHAVEMRHVPAHPIVIVFPKYAPSADTVLEELPRTRAFAKLAANSFNYELLGPRSFAAMGRLVQSTLAFRLTYSRLDEAIEAIDDVHDELAAGTGERASFALDAAPGR